MEDTDKIAAALPPTTPYPGPIAPTSTPWTGTPEGVGQLMDIAFGTAVTHLKPTVAVLTSPDDETTAPFVISTGGVNTIPQSAFDPWRRRPLSRQGTALMTSAASFIAHVNRFKDDDSAIFADDDRTSPQLIAVLDYHERANVENEPVFAEPRFGRHRTMFNFPLSDEWKVWQAQNATPMGMADFAAFLEDRIVDVHERPGPTDVLSDSLTKLMSATQNANIAGPAALFNLASSFKVLENATMMNAVNLATGEAEMKFKSEHVDEQGSKLVVPNLFLIAIPVFRHGEPFLISARLRYRHREGIVKFWYELHGTELVFDTAFKESAEYAASETGLPLFFGAPEYHETQPF